MQKSVFIILLFVITVEHLPVGDSVYFAVPPKKITYDSQIKATAEDSEVKHIELTRENLQRARSDFPYGLTFSDQYFPVSLKMNNHSYAFEVPQWNVDYVYRTASRAFYRPVNELCSKPAEGVRVSYEKTENDMVRLMLDALKTGKHITLTRCG